jgi:hypothetical protein
LAREVYAIGGRLILIDSILNNTPLYMMSFYSLPKKLKKRLDYFGADYFGENLGVKKYHIWSNGR